MRAATIAHTRSRRRLGREASKVAKPKRYMGYTSSLHRPLRARGDDLEAIAERAVSGPLVPATASPTGCGQPVATIATNRHGQRSA